MPLLLCSTLQSKVYAAIILSAKLEHTAKMDVHVIQIVFYQPHASILVAKFDGIVNTSTLIQMKWV